MRLSLLIQRIIVTITGRNDCKRKFAPKVVTAARPPLFVLTYTCFRVEGQTSTLSFLKSGYSDYGGASLYTGECIFNP